MIKSHSNAVERKYYHGGVRGLAVGDWVLPPSVTKVDRTLVHYVDAETMGRELVRPDKVVALLKAHLMTGVKTHIVTSVEITGKDANDSPMLPGLVAKTAENFTLREVSADKGYSGVDNHEAIAKAKATPFIAFKVNATGEAGGVFEKMFHLYRYHRDAFLASYHKRSNVVTVFSMIKAKFSTRLRCKGDTAQIDRKSVV